MKADLDQLADRHLRPDPQGALADPGDMKPGFVLVQVSSDMASAMGVQHLVWMLVNLLSRQFKVVQGIVFDVPDVRLHSAIAPFGQKAGLVETLEECVRLVSGAHIKAYRHGDGPAADISLGIGDIQPSAERHWQLYADGWRYAIVQNGELPTMPPQSGLSIGPYLCASFAAGEVFKLLRGLKPGRGDFIKSHHSSAWTMTSEKEWDALIEGPGVDGFDVLPHFYFAGAGAVAQAAALCLGSSSFKGSCSAIDSDKLDLTNGNRYSLSTLGDNGKSKVELMRDYLQSRGFSCQVIPEWWQDFVTSSGRLAPNEAIRQLEREYKFPIVLSCVDKNLPRHDLQRALPQLLIGGSTDGLSAKASIFDLGVGTACLKCHNPPESRNVVIEERRAAIQKMDGEDRAAYARDLGLSERDVTNLLEPSECGKLSESDLARFAAASPEMSVGFVSMAAGVLLVAQLLRYLSLGATSVTQNGAMALTTFARAQLRLMHIGPDSTCDCVAVRQGRWRNIWNGSYRA